MNFLPCRFTSLYLFNFFRRDKLLILKKRDRSEMLWKKKKKLQSFGVCMSRSNVAQRDKIEAQENLKNTTPQVNFLLFTSVSLSLSVSLSNTRKFRERKCTLYIDYYSTIQRMTKRKTSFQISPLSFCIVSSLEEWPTKFASSIRFDFVNHYLRLSPFFIFPPKKIKNQNFSLVFVVVVVIVRACVDNLPLTRPEGCA